MHTPDPTPSPDSGTVPQGPPWVSPWSPAPGRGPVEPGGRAVRIAKAVAEQLPTFAAYTAMIYAQSAGPYWFAAAIVAGLYVLILAELDDPPWLARHFGSLAWVVLILAAGAGADARAVGP